MQLGRIQFLSLTATVFAIAGFVPAAHARGTMGAITVPMQVELNRPYIDVTLTRRTAHAGAATQRRARPRARNGTDRPCRCSRHRD
jgi:hypothetical protein